MEAAAYDAWYRSPRGHWIGDTEFMLLRRMLGMPEAGTLLDVGCGTGYFSKRFAQAGLAVTGLDPDRAWLSFARHNGAGAQAWVAGGGVALPFASNSFDFVVSVTALCFVAEQRSFLNEMLRVARRRIVVGVLNRHGWLYWQKGRHGGEGAYRGAHWHTAAEIRELFAGLPAANLKIQTGVLLPSGGSMARLVERTVPASFPCGSFLAASADCLPSP